MSGNERASAAAVLPPRSTVEIDVEAELAALRRDYARGLPQRVADLEVVLRRVREGAVGAKAELRLLAHRIRGTAGSYGFEAVGEGAGAIEEVIRSYLDDVPVPPVVLQTMESQILTLKGMADAAVGGERASAGLPPRPLVNRVLVVDDDPALLVLVRELARRHAVEILPARFSDAVATASANPPEAAILDVDLGGEGGGFDVARRLRELPKCSDLPIAFISARDSVESRVAAAHTGGSLFLSKPFDDVSLGDALHHLLAQRPAKPRVLLIDDDEELSAWVAAILVKEGMEVLALKDTRDLMAQLDRFRPDLLLLDVVMPQIDGLDVCRLLRTASAWRDIPILFLTGQTSVDARVAAFRAGADDYLVKPVVPEELVARVTLRLERARLMLERAERDALTGLLLRRPFMTRLAAVLADARRRKHPVSIGLLDIDHFKKVNDTYGHLAGDRVLATFGRLLSTRFRANDLRARWGGEELILCFPAEPATTSTAIVERLLEEVRGLTFDGDGGERFGLSFSAGIAVAPADGDNAHDLLRVADRRLYAAKRDGRSRVVSLD